MSPLDWAVGETSVRLLLRLSLLTFTAMIGAHAFFIVLFDGAKRLGQLDTMTHELGRAAAIQTVRLFALVIWLTILVIAVVTGYSWGI